MRSELGAGGASGSCQSCSRRDKPGTESQSLRDYFTRKALDSGNNVIIPPAGGYIQCSYTRLRDGYLLDTHAKKFSGAK